MNQHSKQGGQEIMKCGCSTNGTIRRAGEKESKPGCVIHSCTEALENQPVLRGREARCAYYGKPVKTSSYNGNCCNVCKSGDICRCQRPSSKNLWFFKHKPDQKYDEFYCACHGAD